MPPEWKRACLTYVRSWVWKEEEKEEERGRKKKSQHTLRATTRISEFQAFETTRVSICCFKQLSVIPCSGNLGKLT